VVEAITHRSETVHSESDAITAIAKWRRNNGTFVSTIDVEREIWDRLCKSEPKRCGLVVLRHEKTPADIIPRERTPEVQGPPIWTFLNTLAAAWTPGLHDYFLLTIDSIGAILDCQHCREHWREVVRDNPTTEIKTRYAACKWVNDCHNAVSRLAGKSFFPYSEMVRLYGAPLN
jgi:hypothetical protein